jgi:hypothetical protein
MFNTGDLLRLKEVETGVVRALKEVSSDEGAGAGLYEHRLEFLSEVSTNIDNIHIVQHLLICQHNLG